MSSKVGVWESAGGESERRATPPPPAELLLLVLCWWWFKEQFCRDLSKDAVIVAMFGVAIIPFLFLYFFCLSTTNPT